MSFKLQFGSLPLSTFGRQLLRSGALGLLVRVLAVLAGLVSSVVLARVLGPEEYGVYAFVFAVISVLALPVQLGLPTLVVRETVKAVTLKDWPLLRGVWIWAGRAVVVGAAVVVGSVLLWMTCFDDALEARRYEALLWGLPLIPLIAFGEVRSAALRGLQRIFQGNFPDQVLRPLLLAGFVGAVFLFFNTPVTAQLALGLSAFAALLTFCLGTVFLLRARPSALKQTPGVRMSGRQWARTMVPLAMITGLYVINSNTDIVMLGLWRTDAEVAVYRVALSISSMAAFGLTTLNMVIQPYLVELYAKGDLARMQKIASIGALLSLLVTVAVLVLFIFVGSPLLSFIYGSGYGGAYFPLIILSIGSAFHATFGMGGTLLTMTGHERYVLRSSILTAILNLLLNAVLIPSYGVTGAAIATAVALLSGQLVAYGLARKILRVDGSPYFVISATIRRFLVTRVSKLT